MLLFITSLYPVSVTDIKTLDFDRYHEVYRHSMSLCMSFFSYYYTAELCSRVKKKVKQVIYCGISSSSNRSPCMLSEWICPAGSAQEGISSREATERSSSETAGGGLRSDSTLLTILGLSVSSCTEERATETEKQTVN